MRLRCFWLGLYVLSGACVHESSSAIVITDGALLLDWTINGTKDPNQCIQEGAAVVRIEIFDARGGFVGEFEQECTAFATTISLAPGTYSGRAHLADRVGVARTTSIDVLPWTIEAATTLDVSLDFPQNSFFQPHRG